MRKLYKLKKWYSLNDAANRLTLTLNEPVTVQDIRQLMADGHVAAYWNIDRKPAREIAPATMIYSEGDALFHLMKEMDRLPPDCKRVYVEKYEPQSEYIEKIEGLFKINTEDIGAAASWLKATAADKDCEYTSLEGTFLVGEDGKLWQLMAPFSENEYAKNHEPKKPWNSPDNFYPTFELPEPSEIVVSKEEIERFEAQFSEPPKNENQLEARERTANLNIIGALADLYWRIAYPGKGYTQAKLLEDLEQYKGFHGMSERNLKDKLTKAMKAIRS